MTAVPAPWQSILHTAGLGTVHDLAYVVIVDVVTCDDVRILLAHECGEPVDDLRLIPNEGSAFADLFPVLHNRAYGIDELMLDRILDIE